MINRECFVRAIKKIEDFRQSQIEATNALHRIFDMDGHSILLFGDSLKEEIINLLSMSFDSGNDIKEMEHIEDWITWYLYEKGSDGKAWIYDKEYTIKNANDLYNLLIRWKKYQLSTMLFDN